MTLAQPWSGVSVWRRLRTMPCRRHGGLLLWSIPYLLVLLATLYAVRERPVVGPLALVGTHNGWRIAWVWPGSTTWDRGLRAGDTVLAPGTGTHGLTLPRAAPVLSVRTATGQYWHVNLAVRSWPAREYASLLVMSLIFFLFAVLVYTTATERVAARAFCVLSIGIALALTLAWPTALGHPWALSLEFVTVTLFGSAWAAFFLVFPGQRSLSRPYAWRS